MDWKKTRNQTQLDQFGLDHWLMLHLFLDGSWMKHSQPDRLNWLQPPQDTPQKYLQNAPKNIENDQDLNKLLKFLLTITRYAL